MLFVLFNNINGLFNVILCKEGKKAKNVNAIVVSRNRPKKMAVDETAQIVGQQPDDVTLRQVDKKIETADIAYLV